MRTEALTDYQIARKQLKFEAACRRTNAQRSYAAQTDKARFERTRATPRRGA